MVRLVMLKPILPFGIVIGIGKSWGWEVKTRFGWHLFKLEYRTGFDVDKAVAALKKEFGNPQINWD